MISHTHLIALTLTLLNVLMSWLFSSASSALNTSGRVNSSVLTWLAMAGREIPASQLRKKSQLHTLVARLVDDTEHILLLLG